MALIGTISGSNGTTTSAVSGSLIIADRPPGSFPSLPAGVNLYVSGARGVDVDSASALFGGDVFMSGALGLQEYLQLRPINNKRFPTATTASYIYASGSTNDMYFTQFSGSFRNDVRLRWLEGTLTTGLLNGGIVSTVNGTTTFSVTAGAGIIVAQNAAITSDPYPTVDYVSWPAVVSSSLIYSGSAQITYVSVESGGTINQSNSPPTLAQFKSRVQLGRVLHQTGSVSNGAINAPAMAYAMSSNTFDFIRPFGPLKVSGHVLAASGSTLGLTKTAGDSYAEGRNYAFDPSAPNTILSADDPALTNCKLYRVYVSGSTTITDTGTGNAGFAVIDRAQYNNGGTLASVGNSEWTNQRVYWFPKSVNRALFVYYGQAKYGTLLEAVTGLLTENFVEGDNTRAAAIYVGSVSVKGNETNLADTVNVRISQGGLFRSAASGGGGGGGGPTAPAGLTSYVQFNDGGAFGGDSNLTFNSVSHALTVGGDITGSNALLSGDLALNGGNITTTAPTFNLVTGSATTVNFAQSATAVAIGAATGRTTIANDLAISTGNIIGAPGSGANVMTLLSSGNIVAKLDVNNDAAGHKFIVQDYTGASQFFVGENGNAELTGSFTATGSIKALSGFSGSLTKLADGTNYLIAGSSITLSTGSSGAVTISGGPVGFGSAITWGDGADGDVTITAGTTTLARDMYYNSLTVQSGGILKPAGFRIFVKTFTQVDAGGSINDNGNDAGIPPAIGGALSAIGWMQLASGGGGLGRNSTGVGSAGATVTNAITTNGTTFARGGAGGSATNPSSVGGTGGVATLGTTIPGQRLFTVFSTFRGYLGAIFNGTTGGGGGGVDTTFGGTGTSGGGGGAGRGVWIASNTIICSGTISANGGNGANAVGTGLARVGGGGGGAGGMVVIQTTTPEASLTNVTVNGGGFGADFGLMFSPSVAGNAGHRIIIVYAS